MGERFDYIVVGGGAAGCVLASRLSARSGCKVLLIEAGMDTPPGQTPADILDPYPMSYSNPRYRWPLSGHALTAQTSPAAPLLHAKVMGGGSSIMGMIMLRGTPEDYDGWAAGGAEGWSWREVLPYFRRLESDLDFGGDLHGNAGPTEIRRHRPADWPPLAKAAQAYATRRGIPFVADMNADFSDGYGALPIAGTTERRASSAISYLTADVRARANLRILPDALAEALVFEGAKVTGVRVRAQGETTVFHARETILAMGALLTPAFLLRQGIGEPEHLVSSGVPVVHALSGVGRNLQNHASLLILAHLRATGVQRNPQRNHNNSMFRYSSGVQGCGAADMALALGSRAGWHEVARRIAHFSPLLLAPASRGRVSLRPGEAADGAQARDGPLIEYNLLGDARDEARLIDAMGRITDLLAAPEVSRLIGVPVAASRLANAARFDRPTRGNILRTKAIALAFDLVPGLGDRAVGSMGEPGGSLQNLLADPARMSEYLRKSITPLAHHAGACKMGAREDPLAVVDPEGRVHGIGGLRIADASVMPTVPRGNTNLPTLMVAEKISDAILGQTAPAEDPGVGLAHGRLPA